MCFDLRPKAASFATNFLTLLGPCTILSYHHVTIYLQTSGSASRTSNCDDSSIFNYQGQLTAQLSKWRATILVSTSNRVYRLWGIANTVIAPLSMDPALVKYASTSTLRQLRSSSIQSCWPKHTDIITDMYTQRHKYFRWTTKTAGLTFVYAIAFPALIGYISYTYEVRERYLGEILIRILTTLGQVGFQRKEEGWHDCWTVDGSLGMIGWSYQGMLVVYIQEEQWNCVEPSYKLYTSGRHEIRDCCSYRQARDVSSQRGYNCLGVLKRIFHHYSNSYTAYWYGYLE
jgi:hypothetical protein